MTQKALLQPVPSPASPAASALARSASSPSAQPSSNPFLSTQQALGNQALLQLLSAGTIQAKLRVSQPGDSDEQEADRIADKIVASTHAPKIHRKCACQSSGTPCSKCEEEESIHRSAASLAVSSSPLSIQRAPAASDPMNTPDKAAAAPSKPSPTPSKTHPLIVEDDAQSVAPHQMRKSAFIGLLRSEACAAADSILKSVGRSTESCPYIAKWLAFYEKQSSEHVERAILKYAPETAGAHNAHQAISLVIVRVRHATLTWAQTGKVSGLPEDFVAQIPGGGFFGAVQKFASTGIGGAILGFIDGHKSEKSGPETSHESKTTTPPTISRKANGEGSAAPAHDASAVRSQLGSGHSLDSRVQSQMSGAFGRDFSTVRVHTDSSAAKLSSNLNARAFTIGHDVAFASGEYQPGTPIGDALIAHELAHVVQQGAASYNSPMPKSADASNSADEGPTTARLETDADLSAVGAVASIWAGAKHGLADIRQNAIPRLRSGLRLQRCKDEAKPKTEPEIACTAQAMGKNVAECMQRVNKQTYNCDTGIHYAQNFQRECPDKWSPEYGSGYADPDYFEKLGSSWNWRLKPRKSASEAIKKWLSGLTVAECLSTVIACEIDAVRAAVGDAKFDSLYGSADKDTPESRRLHVGTKLSLTPVGQASTPGEAAVAGSGTPNNRPAKIGEWYYFKNHPMYLKKHPAGAWQGENSVYLGRDDLGRQLWIGLGSSSGPPLNQPEVTEDQMVQELLDAYNGGRGSSDNARLNQIRAGHGGVLPSEYDPKTSANPSGYPETITKEELLDAGGGFRPSSGKTLDQSRIQDLRDQ
jgi:hypothetical protein